MKSHKYTDSEDDYLILYIRGGYRVIVWLGGGGMGHNKPCGGRSGGYPPAMQGGTRDQFEIGPPKRALSSLFWPIKSKPTILVVLLHLQFF